MLPIINNHRIKSLIEDNSKREGRIFDFIIQALIIISLTAFAIETLPNLNNNTILILNAIEFISITIFSFEYVARILVACCDRGV